MKNARARTRVQKFSESLTHALVMDIIWGRSDVHKIFPFTADWSLVMPASLQIYPPPNTRQRSARPAAGYTDERTRTIKHAGSTNTQRGNSCSLPPLNPVRARHSGLFCISFTSRLMSYFDNMSESH